LSRSHQKPDSLGQRLRDARRRLRLSQTAVAKFLGVNRQTIAGYEQGTRRPDLDQFVRLANLYRATLDEMMTTAKSPMRGDVPMYQPRLNRPKLEELDGVSELDCHELASFDEYLRQRPRRAKRIHFERGQLEAISETVKRWTNQSGIGTAAPIPIFAILAKHGVEVRFTALEELAGALLLGDHAHPDGVLINSDQPYTRQRYSAAHELGHLVLGHRPGEKGRVFVSHLGRRFDPVEVHADLFASELLTPLDVLVDAFKSQSQQFGEEEPLSHQVFRLASTFMVSFQAMTVRLAKLGAIDPAESDALAKEKPGEIAKKIRNASVQSRAAFLPSRMPELIRTYLPKDWKHEASIETVRLLQETAYSDYVASTAEHERTDSAADVYERVAVWIAEKYPVVST
jgi:Zn-dependent peptidase ImmA (M78 family)/transcriptional regulator with XRE-family HTH domain